MSNTDNNQEPDYENLIKNLDPVDPKDPAYEQIFRDLQGGMIKNYGRDYAIYIFIQFDQNNVNEVKQWVRDEVACSVTSTWNQLQNTAACKKMRQQEPNFSGELCKNFFISCQGYKTLGFDVNKPGFDPAFKAGMKENWERSYRLEKPQKDYYWYNPPESWDMGWDQEKAQSNVDALILLAHDCLEELKNVANTVINQCETIGKVIACEAGYVLRDPNNNKSVGSFGFADGISQPLFLQSDYDKYLEKQNIKQEDPLAWDPKASLNLVLVKDPFAAQPYSYGSYCVWQKLETDYDRFKTKVECLADQFEFGNDRERASALVIGRFKDGTPLDLSDKPNQNLGNLNINNFKYDNDLGGGRCPLQAHIRKVNPRNELTASLDKNRIFRAGITYFDDSKTQQPSDSSTLQQCLNKLDYLNDVASKQSLEEKVESVSGLLFVCFQRSISSQFSKLQQEWADKKDFPDISGKGKRYLDPVIGHPANKGFQNPPIQQEWPKKWSNEKESFYYSFYGCVKNRGGEFLFAPSISFLKNLS